MGSLQIGMLTEDISNKIIQYNTIQSFSIMYINFQDKHLTPSEY